MHPSLCITTPYSPPLYNHTHSSNYLFHHSPPYLSPMFLPLILFISISFPASLQITNFTVIQKFSLHFQVCKFFLRLIIHTMLHIFPVTFMSPSHSRTILLYYHSFTIWSEFYTNLYFTILHKLLSDHLYFPIQNVLQHFHIFNIIKFIHII